MRPKEKPSSGLVRRSRRARPNGEPTSRYPTEPRNGLRRSAFRRHGRQPGSSERLAAPRRRQTHRSRGEQDDDATDDSENGRRWLPEARTVADRRRPARWQAVAAQLPMPSWHSTELRPGSALSRERRWATKRSKMTLIAVVRPPASASGQCNCEPRQSFAPSAPMSGSPPKSERPNGIAPRRPRPPSESAGRRKSGASRASAPPLRPRVAGEGPPRHRRLNRRR